MDGGTRPIYVSEVHLVSFVAKHALTLQQIHLKPTRNARQDLQQLIEYEQKQQWFGALSPLMRPNCLMRQVAQELFHKINRTQTVWNTTHGQLKTKRIKKNTGSVFPRSGWYMSRASSKRWLLQLVSICFTPSSSSFMYPLNIDPAVYRAIVTICPLSSPPTTSFLDCGSCL